MLSLLLAASNPWIRLLTAARPDNLLHQRRCAAWKWVDRVGMILVFLAFWFKDGLFAASFLLACLVWATGFVFLGGGLLPNYYTAVARLLPGAAFLATLLGEKPDPGSFSTVLVIVAIVVACYPAASKWNLIERLVIHPILLGLANNTTLRRRLHNVGIALFLVGSVLQLAASFFD